MMMNIDVKIRNPYNNCILRKIIYHQYLPMLIGISDQMGAQTDRLRCEVCQNLILSPMNTGLLRYAVATALTVYGIETFETANVSSFTFELVATALTVYGIETNLKKSFGASNDAELQQPLPFTVLKLDTFSATILCRIFSCNSPYRLRY